MEVRSGSSTSSTKRKSLGAIGCGPFSATENLKLGTECDAKQGVRAPQNAFSLDANQAPISSAPCACLNQLIVLNTTTAHPIAAGHDDGDNRIDTHRPSYQTSFALS